jgi:uncharacterized protein with PIN domain
MEYTDSEYRERLTSVLEKLEEHYKNEESYEACQECKLMLEQMDGHSTETIKKTLVTFEILMNIAGI